MLIRTPVTDELQGRPIGPLRGQRQISVPCGAWKKTWTGSIRHPFLNDCGHSTLRMKTVSPFANCLRWLKAPMVLEDGTKIERNRGTPQGGVLTPLTQKVILTVWVLGSSVLGRT